MTQKQALEVKDLAKPCDEALGVITEKECFVCRGRGKEPVIGDYAIRQTSQFCKNCKGTGKQQWKWKPEVNQTVLYGKELMFIVSIGETHLSLLPFGIPYLGEPLDDYVCNPKIVDVIPILEWEEIERVLEGMGYSYAEIDLEDGWWEFQIEMKNFIVGAREKSRQQAVMQAVIQDSNKTWRGAKCQK